MEQPREKQNGDLKELALSGDGTGGEFESWVVASSKPDMRLPCNLKYAIAYVTYSYISIEPMITW